MNNLNRALACAEQGWLVFPSIGKRPLVKWSTEATTDVDVILSWWLANPDADVCIKTGAESNLVVIDWDRYKVGGDTAGHGMAQHALGDRLPVTYTIATPKGGLHYYYQHPGYPVANSAGTLWEYTDVRGDGGMVVYYGDGTPWQYTMPVIPDDLATKRKEREVAPPEAIIEWDGDDDGTDVAVNALMAAVDVVLNAEPGTRNPTLFQQAADVFKLVAGGELAESVALSALDMAGRTAGLPADEVYATLMSARKRGFEEPFSPSRLLNLKSVPAGENWDPIDLPDSYGEDEYGKCTDIGNALRLADRFEYDLRYAPSHGWLRYSGGKLEQVGGLPYDEASVLPKLIRAEAARAAEQNKGTDRVTELTKWAEKSSTGARMREALTVMADLPLIRVKPEHLDKDPLELNTPVGVYNLESGSLRYSTAKDLMTRITHVKPVPQAPAWETFLSQVLPSHDLRAFVQRAVGYSITGLTREEVFFMLHGEGQNGKSKFLEAIAGALGNYAATFEARLLTTQVHEQHSTGTASLAGVRFAYSSEIDQGSHLDEAKVKALTGGDTITARFMRRDNFQFKPSHKLWLATNYLPVIKGTDRGMWRRVLVIPFGVNITDEQRDIYLAEKLAAEAQGILAWCMDGAREYLEHGLHPSVEVQTATAAYKEAEDTVAQFMGELTRPMDGGMVLFANLYARYKLWSDEVGVKASSAIALSKELTKRGYELGHTTGNKKVCYGILLTEGVSV